MNPPLEGLRAIIVEDEAFVVLLLEDMLADLGCTVVGSASRLAAALDLAERGDFDLAVLDVNLAGERVDPVARRLVELERPFVFSTGYGPQGLDAEWHGYPVLSKPFRIDGLLGALEIALAGRPAGSP